MTLTSPETKVFTSFFGNVNIIQLLLIKHNHIQILATLSPPANTSLKLN